MFVHAAILQVGPKNRTILVVSLTPVYDGMGRCSKYQNVQLFIRSKTVIMNVAIFEIYSHACRKNILH